MLAPQLADGQSSSPVQLTEVLAAPELYAPQIAELAHGCVMRIGLPTKAVLQSGLVRRQTEWTGGREDDV